MPGASHGGTRESPTGAVSMEEEVHETSAMEEEAPVAGEGQQQQQQHVGQAASFASAASSARRPGGELRTGRVLLLGCGAPVAGCLPTTRGVTTAARRLTRKPTAAAAGNARRGRVGMERESRREMRRGRRR